MTPRESRSLPAGSESGTSEAGTWLGLGLGLGLGSGLRWGGREWSRVWVWGRGPLAVWGEARVWAGVEAKG